MKRNRTRQRSAVATILVLAFVVLGLSVPVFIGGRPQTIALQSATVLAASRDSYIVSSPIRLLSSPRLDLERGTLSLQSDKSGRPRTGEAILAVLANGSGRLLLEDATLVLNVTGEGWSEATGPSNADAMTAPLLTALASLSFEAISLRRGVIVLRRAKGGTEVLSDVRLDVTHKRGQSMTAVGSLELQGRQLSVDATLGLQSDRKDITLLPLKAAIKGSFVDAAIYDGKLLLADTLEVSAATAEVQTSALRKAASWLGALWPGERGLGPFAAKGPMHWSDRTISFQNAAFRMDGNDATGTLALTWGQERPEIEGTLALRRFDLTRYLDASTVANAEKPKTSGAGWFKLGLGQDAGSVAPTLIRHVEADVRLSADQTSIGTQTFGRSAVSISVKNGKLLADVAELEIDSQGSARGQFTVDMAGAMPRYVMRGKLELVDSATLSTLAFGHPAVGGRGNVVFDLAGAGDTSEQVLATLNGKVGFELPQGGTLAVDLGGLVAAAAKTPDLQGWGSAGRSPMRFETLSSRFSLQSGKLVAETLKASDKSRLYLGAGELQTEFRTFDAEISIVRLPVAGAPQDASPLQKTDILSFRGPWQSPLIRYSSRPSKSAAPTAPAAPSLPSQPMVPGQPATLRTPG